MGPLASRSPGSIDSISNADGIDAGHESVSAPANILIVDDLTEKLLVFKTVLEDLGQNLVMVHSGAEALREILNREFAVILLDVNMPDIDGLETASMIRRYKRTAHTPIIFITSYVDEMQTARGYSLGAVDYILSPVVPDVLRSKVMVFVQLYEMQRRTRFLAEERVRFVQAQVAREAAEETTRRSNFLSNASRELSASLEMNTAMQRLVDLVTPELAALSMLLVDMDDEPSIMLARSASSGTAQTTSLLPYEGLPIEVVEGFIKASHEGRTLQLSWPGQLSGKLSDMQPALKDGDARPRMLLIVPLRLAQRPLGVLALVGPAFSPADIATVEEVVSRAAIAFENAHLYSSLQREILKSRQAEESLQESSRRKDEFLAMLSHELRNPLAPIRNAVEVIRRVAPPDATLTWARDVVDRQTTHMARLIEELLDVSRISQGKISLRKETVELKRIIAHGIETERPLIDARGHKLSVDLPQASVWIDGDFARLAQVISNLLNNAAKYTADGGNITLTASVDADHVNVIIRDEGIGMDSELLPRVFELFAQGERSLDRSQGGLGVGLTLVQRLVEQHGGTVRASSPGLGKGTQVEVSLPCLTELSPHSDIPASPTNGSASSAGVRVLVVDDNADAAESVALFLSLEGNDTTTAPDGTKALELCQTFAPHVAVIDIGLPGLSGYEVAQAIRAADQGTQMLLIALTGYGQSEDQKRALQAGFDYHFTKPVNPDEVQRVISKFVASRNDIRENTAPAI